MSAPDSKARPFRDCIKSLLDNPCIHPEDQKRIAWLVALEAKDAGWTPEEAYESIFAFANDQCDPPVGPSCLKAMLSLVDYAFRKATSLRCESGLLNGKSHHKLALGYSICHKSECDRECSFSEWEEAVTTKEWAPINRCFFEDWEDYLRDEYGPRGQVATNVYHILLQAAIKYRLHPGDNIFIGLRTIAARCCSLDKGLNNLTPMDISRAITLLSMWGLVEVSSRGKPAKYGNKSNSYILRKLPSIRSAIQSLEEDSIQARPDPLQGNTPYMGTTHIGNTSKTSQRDKKTRGEIR